MDLPQARIDARYPAIPETRELSSGRFVAEYLSRNLPVVLRGAAPRFRNRWAPELVKGSVGDALVPVETAEQDPSRRRRVRVSVSELFDTMASGTRSYRVEGYELLKVIAGVGGDFWRD